jgi:hypothetical protein
MRHCDPMQHERFIEREPPLSATAARTTSAQNRSHCAGRKGQLPAIEQIS